MIIRHYILMRYLGLILLLLVCGTVEAAERSESITGQVLDMGWDTMNLFVVVIGVHRSFAYEKEFDAFSLLVSAPVDRGMIFLSKWVSGFIFITTTQLIIIAPFFKLLLLDIPENISFFILTSLLINLAMMSIASIVSGIVIRSNFSEVLLPLLMFPLLSPLMIAATKISNDIINSQSYELWNVWVLIIASIVVLLSLIHI